MPDLVPQIVDGNPVVEACRLRPGGPWSWLVLCDLGFHDPERQAACWLLDQEYRPGNGSIGTWMVAREWYDHCRERWR
jgi:hypothetical protein